MPRWSLVAALLFAMLSTPRVGRAQAPIPTKGQAKEQAKEAKGHYETAFRLFDLGRYDEAIAEFSKSYELSGKPGLLFNIAQSHRLAGRCEEALKFYKRYLTRYPDAPNWAETEAWVAEMEKCAEKGPPSSSSSPAATGEARPQAGTSRAAPGEKPEEQIEPKAQSTPPPGEPAAPQTVDVAVGAGASENVEARAPSFARRHRLSLVLGGTSVALVAAGMGMGLWTYSSYGDLSSTCLGSCSAENVDSVEGKALVTNVLFGAAGAAALTSAVLYFFVEKDRTEIESADVSIVLTGPGASVIVRY